MSEENDNSNKPENEDPIRNNRGAGEELLMQVLKVIGITVAGLVLLAVLAFGLLVGFCALSSRH